MPKGIYDRAASRWEPKPKKVYDPELVDQVRALYVDDGLTMREVAEDVGVSVRVLQTLMPRNGIVRRRAVKRDQRGDRNHMWKGANAGYQALHLRVEQERGDLIGCTRCGQSDPAASYEWANQTGDYANTSDYERMCRPCHRTFDAWRRRATGERTIPSHLQKGGRP